MTDLDLIFVAMVIMFSVPICMMAYDSCEYSIFDGIKERKLEEKRRMRQTIRKLGEALNR